MPAYQIQLVTQFVNCKQGDLFLNGLVRWFLYHQVAFILEEYYTSFDAEQQTPVWTVWGLLNLRWRDKHH